MFIHKSRKETTPKLRANAQVVACLFTVQAIWVKFAVSFSLTMSIVVYLPYNLNCFISLFMYLFFLLSNSRRREA
jgi:hypothetical protein